jgi:hypothetical protein
MTGARRLVLPPTPNPDRCERCGSAPVFRTGAMTAYAWAGWPDPNPNRDVYLCAPCRADHIEHWTEMWNEYYSNLL